VSASTPGRDDINGGDVLLPRTRGDTKFIQASRSEMTRRNNNKRRAPRNGRRKTMTNQVKPPQFVNTVQLRKTFRYTSTSSAVTTIVDADIVSVAGSIGKVTNTSVALYGYTAKLHKISVWTPPASQGAAATVSLQWYNSTGADLGPEMSDTSNSVTQPAKLVTRPPRGTLASFWLGTAGTPILIMTCPTGSIIDIDATVQLSTVATVTAAVGTAVVGTPYWLALDQVGAGTQHYLPVGLPTTS
jgi:hypothetical protein